MSKFSRLFRQLNTFDRSRKFSFFPKMTRACPKLSRLDSLTLAFCRRKLCSSWKCRQHSGSTAAAVHTCDECKLSWHVIFTSPIFESDMNPYLLSVGVTPKMPTRTTLAFFRSKMAAACRDYCRASIWKATTKNAPTCPFNTDLFPHFVFGIKLLLTFVSRFGPFYNLRVQQNISLLSWSSKSV